MAGTWEDSRRADSSVLNLFGLLGPMTISAHDDGTISFPIPRHGEMHWREIAPFVWQQIDGPEKIQALVVDGHPTLLGMDMAPPHAFMPAPAWRSPAWITPVLGLSICILLIAGLSWPISALLRRRSGRRLIYQGRAARFYHVSRALSLAAAVLYITLFATLVWMAGAYDRFSDSTDLWLLFIKLTAMLGFAAALIVTLSDVAIFWTAKPKRLAKLWSLLIAASSAMVLWSALVFHVANFSSHY
jgi:hypothetical protein